MSSDARFREIDHTADRALEVRAPDLEGLLAQAAAGMYDISGLQFGSELQVTRRFEFDATDREQFLVQFLSELLYVLHAEHLAFDTFDVREEASGAEQIVEAVGDPVAGIDTEIKAVTWHDISVEADDQGVRGRVTFDV